MASGSDRADLVTFAMASFAVFFAEIFTFVHTRWREVGATEIAIVRFTPVTRKSNECADANARDRCVNRTSFV